MKLYKENKGYYWEIDRFYFFTESEKCSILDALKNILRHTKELDVFNDKGGMNEMMENMINELDKSLENGDI